MSAFKTIFTVALEDNIVALDWNLEANHILAVSSHKGGFNQDDEEYVYTKDKITLTLINASDYTTVRSGDIFISHNITCAAVNDTLDTVLLVSRWKVFIINLSEFSISHELQRSEIYHENFLKGCFAETGKIFLTFDTLSSRSCCGFWDYNLNQFYRYETETDDYGSDVILHPSKKLIGAFWTSEYSGFFIHNATPENNRLKYFDFDIKKYDREEFAYAPSFNYEGDKVAIIVDTNFDQDNRDKAKEKLSLYRLSDQEDPILEIEFDNPEKLHTRETLVLGRSEYVVLRKTKGIDIIDISTESIQRLADAADHLSANPITKELAISVEKKTGHLWPGWKI